MLTGAYRDVPRELQRDPRLTSRIEAGLQDMDDAVLGVTRLMEDTSRRQRSLIGGFLQQRPDLAACFAEIVADEARAVGVSPARRLQLRSMSTQVTWRMTRQPVSLLFNQCCDAVNKVAETSSKAPPVGSAEEEAGRQPLPPGEGAVRTGAVMLGIAGVHGVATVIGFATRSASFGAIAGTTGAVALLAGLITLITGLTLRSNAAPETTFIDTAGGEWSRMLEPPAQE